MYTRVVLEMYFSSAVRVKPQLTPLLSGSLRVGVDLYSALLESRKAHLFLPTALPNSKPTCGQILLKEMFVHGSIICRAG